MAAHAALPARAGRGAGGHRGRAQHRAAAAPGGGDGARRCRLGAAGGRVAGQRRRPRRRAGRGRLCPGSDRPGGADPPRLRPLRRMPAAAGRAGCSAGRRRALQRGQRGRRCAAGVGGTAELGRRRRAGVGWPHAALSARSPQRTLGAGGGRRARPSGGCRAPSAARAAPGVGSRLRLRRGAGACHADGTAGRDGGARRAGVGLPHRGLRADPALGRRGAVRGSRSDPAARSGG